MRLVLCGAGAYFSIKDVERGHLAGLRANGHEVYHLNLDQRLEVAARWLTTAWRRSRVKVPDLPRPNIADAYYHGGVGAIEKALRHDVDWVIVISAMFIHPDIFVMLRRAGRKVCIVFTESPYQDESQAKVAALVDLCTTNERSSVERLRQANPNTYYLPQAFDPLHHYPGGPADPGHDVVFVGTGFQERIDLLAAVDWTDIDLGLYGTWTLLPSRHPLRRYVRGGPMDNEKAARLYRGSKIGLNLYRTAPGAESVNPRALELAADAVCQVSDYRAEGAELFGWTLPTFDSPEALEDRVGALLRADRERRNRANESSMRLWGWDFTTRAGQLADLLTSHGAARSAAPTRELALV